ncbi:MAG: GNAT family N-acetyltransferase [Candidatus Binatia bacterium]
MAVIRSYRAGDEQGICRLFSTVFQLELPLAVWRWKYLRDGNPPPVFVAEEDGQIICHFGAIRQRLVWQDTEGWGFDSVDTMVHPHQQGRGLFRRTVQAFMRELCEGQSWFMYGFPTERHRRLGELLVGYEPIARVYRLHKATSLLGPAHENRETAFDMLPLDWDVQWQRLEPQFDLVNRRDRAFLVWRYWMRPGKRYRFVTVLGEPVLAVVGINKGKASLMEFLVEPENIVLARALLAGVEAILQDERVSDVEAWFPAFTWESRFLRDLGGFAAEEAEHWLECRLFDRRFSAVWLAEHFYYSLSDFDVY